MSFRTPFTQDGRVRGKLAEQFIRLTTLDTEFPFPHVLTRIAVKSRSELEVNPVQNAVSSLESRIKQFHIEIQKKEIDKNGLQSLLQGSLLTQVNEGPLEMCTLLNEEGKYSSEDIAKLRKCLSNFLKVCSEALNLNKTVIAVDQKPFQDALEKGKKLLKKKKIAYVSGEKSKKKKC